MKSRLQKVTNNLQVIFLLIIMLSVFSTSAKSYKSDILKATNKKESGAYVSEKFVSLMGKKFESSDMEKIIIIGDSHAQDFVNMAFEGNHLANYQVKTRHIPTQCQVVLSKDYDKYIKQKSKELCKKSDSVEAALDQIALADIIILVANWTAWSAKELPTTIKNLNLTDRQKVYVVGRKNFGKVKLRKLLRKSKEKLLAIRNDVDSKQESIASTMEDLIDKDVYVDFQNTICQSKNKCPIFTDEVKLITFDGGHLTKNGAKYLGDILFSKTILNDL